MTSDVSVKSSFVWTSSPVPTPGPPVHADPHDGTRLPSGPRDRRRDVTAFRGVRGQDSPSPTYRFLLLCESPVPDDTGVPRGTSSSPLDPGRVGWVRGHPARLRASVPCAPTTLLPPLSHPVRVRERTSPPTLCPGWVSVSPLLPRRCPWSDDPRGVTSHPHGSRVPHRTVPPWNSTSMKNVIRRSRRDYRSPWRSKSRNFPPVLSDLSYCRIWGLPPTRRRPAKSRRRAYNRNYAALRRYRTPPRPQCPLDAPPARRPPRPWVEVVLKCLHVTPERFRVEVVEVQRLEGPFCSQTRPPALLGVGVPRGHRPVPPRGVRLVPRTHPWGYRSCGGRSSPPPSCRGWSGVRAAVPGQGSLRPVSGAVGTSTGRAVSGVASPDFDLTTSSASRSSLAMSNYFSRNDGIYDWSSDYYRLLAANLELKGPYHPRPHSGLSVDPFLSRREEGRAGRSAVSGRTEKDFRELRPSSGLGGPSGPQSRTSLSKLGVGESGVSLEGPEGTSESPVRFPGPQKETLSDFYTTSEW